MTQFPRHNFHLWYLNMCH